jgi:hypothetical protein
VNERLDLFGAPTVEIGIQCEQTATAVMDKRKQ